MDHDRDGVTALTIPVGEDEGRMDSSTESERSDCVSDDEWERLEEDFFAQDETVSSEEDGSDEERRNGNTPAEHSDNDYSDDAGE